jgi:ABC-type lipoprotein export system ATPase subunit
MRAADAQSDGGALVVCENLVKIYKVADLEVVALQGLDLRVDQGEVIAVVGASGSGKSTLQNILGGVDTPTAGKARVAGYDLTVMAPRERTVYRRRVVGFVWQQTSRNLLPYLDVGQNVELPMLLDGLPRPRRRARTRDLLKLVRMYERAGDRPEHLSGGEQQRVALAVALANEPELVLADEPTGELDSQSAAELFASLRRMNEEIGVTVIVLTHDLQVSGQVSRTVRIRDGRTATETLRRRTDDGREVVAEEFAVLDRVGRLQLPHDYVTALELERRVRLALEEDHIGVWPDRPAERRNEGRDDDD